MRALVEFLDALEDAGIQYYLSKCNPHSIMVELAFGHERWEVEFCKEGDCPKYGDIDVERFVSDGSVRPESDLYEMLEGLRILDAIGWDELLRLEREEGISSAEEVIRHARQQQDPDSGRSAETKSELTGIELTSVKMTGKTPWRRIENDGSIAVLLDSLNKLEADSLCYHLSKRDGAIVVGITIPGEKWEVEYRSASTCPENGCLRIERFVSDGGIRPGSELDLLFQ